MSNAALKSNRTNTDISPTSDTIKRSLLRTDVEKLLKLFLPKLRRIHG